MKNRLLILVALLAMVLPLVAGNKKNYPQETRDLPTFNSMRVSCAVEVDLHIGKTQSVVVESDVLPYVKTDVRGNTLIVRVDTKKRYDKAKLHITIPELQALELSGASELKCKDMNVTDVCTIEVSGASDVDMRLKAKEVKVTASGASEVDLRLEAKELKMRANGASEVDLKGSADTAFFDMSGSSDADADDLVVQSAEAELSGASDLSVYAQQSLTVKASGASDIKYKGSPILKTRISGASRVVNK